jgi:hypothetical protein
MIEDLWKRLEKKDVIVIGVDAEEPADVVRRFAEKNKITYPIALTTDNQNVMRIYAPRAIPTAAIIDKDGIIAVYLVRENPDTGQLLRSDIDHVSSLRYVAPKPKFIQAAQDPFAPRAPVVSGPGGPDPNWQPKTADEFLGRGYA